MNIVPFDPFRLSTPARGRRLHDLLFSDDLFAPENGARMWAPMVDIHEEDARFVVTADIPGVSPKDIEVTFENGVLAVRGERIQESTEEEKQFRRTERSYGSFERRFAFPDTVDPDGITAKGKDGVLEVVVPKKAAAAPKKISVN